MAPASKCLPVKNLQGLTQSAPAHPAVDPIELAMLALDDRGVIMECGQACERVFGYGQDELAGRHVSTLLPQLQNTELVQEDRINSRLAFLCRCAMPFQARHRDGQCFASELFINRLGSQKVVVLVRRFEGRASARVLPLR